MKLSVIRNHGTVGYTHGKLYIDGVYFCDTLEDEERDVKIPTATAIRKGLYRVILDFSTRFKRVMPHILNVPEFDGVRIHSGNTTSDTDGCLLVGEYLAEAYVKNSRDTFNKLFPKLQAAIKANEAITIEIS